MYAWGGEGGEGSREGSLRERGSRKAKCFLLWGMGIQRTAEEGFSRW